MAKKQFKAESRRLLDLMINSIYTHKEIFLREIISNASDDIDKLAYRALTDENVGLNRGDFAITITRDPENRILTISDNGIGMDYDELEKTGNESSTRYTAEKITTTVKNKNGKEASRTIEPELISTKVDKSEVTQTTDKIQQKVGSTTVTLADKKVALGDENATEPLVLGNQLAQLMLEFLTECSKITTPTLMGTMPAVNVPNFASLISKIQNFLSKTSYTQ